MTTRYNVRFNGEESYKKGLRQIETSVKNDYSTLLPIYPISDHSLGVSVSGPMATCIAKCEKAIKEHIATDLRAKVEEDKQRLKEIDRLIQVINEKVLQSKKPF